jgi:hypothetical protein
MRLPRLAGRNAPERSERPSRQVLPRFWKDRAKTVKCHKAFTRSGMSPTIFREQGFRFFFFSREEDRMHVHIVSADGEAKYWLEPEIALARNHRLTARQLKQIEAILETHRDEILSAWRQHFHS